MPTILTYALTSLSSVKDALDITNSDDDDLLINLINASTEMIENYCGRRFTETTYTNEIYDGVASKVLLLRNWPVSSIGSLQIRSGDFDSPSWDTIDSGLWTLLTDGGHDRGAVYLDAGFREFPYAYRITTYTAGYNPIPDDLRQACEMLVTYLFNERKSKGIKSQTLGRYSVTFSDPLKKIEDSGASALLAAYHEPTI